MIQGAIFLSTIWLEQNVVHLFHSSYIFESFFYLPRLKRKKCSKREQGTLYDTDGPGKVTVVVRCTHIDMWVKLGIIANQIHL